MPGNTSKIEISIEVDDKGSVKVRQLGTEAEKTARKGGKAFKDMDTSVGGFNNSLSAGIGRIRSFGVAWAGFMGIFAGAGTVAGLGRLATEYENSIFSMSKTFGERTDYMIHKAEELSIRTRKYYDLSAVAYAFTKTADSMERYGITGDRYLNLVARAADVGAAKNLQLKESIDRIESAMRGEAEASEYLGVTLNDTYMKNIAFGGALKNVWERLSDNQKAQARYAELLDQTEKYQGAATEAADTLSGSLSSLWSTIKDRLNPSLKESAEYLTAMAKGLRDVLTKTPGEMGLQKQLEAINAQISQIEAHHKWLNQAGVPIGFGAMLGGKGGDDLATLKAHAQSLNELARAADAYRKATTAPAGGRFDPEALKPPIDPKAAAKAAGGLGPDFWQIQAAERYEVQSRAYDRLIEQEQAYQEQSGDIARDFWQVQAAERYEVQSRGLAALIEAEEQSSQSLIQLSERTAWAMQENFSNFYFDAMTGKLDSLSDYFRSFFESVLRGSTDMLGQLTTQGLFGADFKGGGWLSMAASAIGSRFGGGSAGAATSLASARWSPRAGGGWINEPVVGRGMNSGNLYTLGERESELVVPRSKMSGGRDVSISITNHITVNGSEGNSAETARTIGGIVTAQVRATLADEMRPGGMLAR